METTGRSTSDLLDSVHGAHDEGGFTADRLGWHLLGCDDDADWPGSRDLKGDVHNTMVDFYRTIVRLGIQEGLDVPFAFSRNVPDGGERAVTSKKPAHCSRSRLSVRPLCPRRAVSSATQFPLSPGILNCDGDSTRRAGPGAVP